MWLHNKSIIMIQNKMHKNGQIITINNHPYKVVDSGREHIPCLNCDLDFTNDCLGKRADIFCTRTIPIASILKRIDNVKLK